jgi:hypothetical protein
MVFGTVECPIFGKKVGREIELRIFLEKKNKNLNQLYLNDFFSFIFNSF